MPRYPFTRRHLLSARSGHATHHRRRMSPSRQRVTREVTRRAADSSADSIGLVEHNVRLKVPVRPSRSTVSVSSSPSRRLAAARD